MDWETLYSPNLLCRLYGVPWWQSALVKNGTSRGYKQAICRAYGQSVFLRYGTAYFELEAEQAIFDTAIRALAEGNSLRSTARIVQIDQDTACAWLHRAALHCRQVMLYLWQHLPVSECQLDELWSFVHTKEHNLLAAKRCCETYGDAWVWVAFAPVWRLVLAVVVGKRTQESANLLLHRVAHVSDDRIPFFTSDQLAEYRTALLEVYGQWYQPGRNGDRGCFPKPRRVAPPDLVYAQVVKRHERGHVVAVTHKVVFGSAEALESRLAGSPASSTINTSFVERDNLTLRQHNRRLTRKTLGFSKELSWLERQLWVALAYYHLVLPHASLRMALADPEPTRGTGSTGRWRPVTPAMAAGVTNHVWTATELLSYRVPATFLDRLDGLERLFASFDDAHHGYRGTLPKNWYQGHLGIFTTLPRELVHPLTHD